MIKQIVGGVITVVIGGTVYTVSQADVSKKFADNTGMSQEQAQQYVNNISPSDLQSFSDAGKEMVADGNTILSTMSDIDCTNYTYKWETSSLSCSAGKIQLKTLGNDEIALGNCYQSLDTDLGSSAESKMNECISDIDMVDSDYDLPIATAVLDTTTITDAKNTNVYNKSVLQAALESQ